MISETDTVRTVAGLMMAAARTAPKSMGIDSLVIKTVTGPEMEAVANRMDGCHRHGNRLDVLQHECGSCAGQ